MTESNTTHPTEDLPIIDYVTIVCLVSYEIRSGDTPPKTKEGEEYVRAQIRVNSDEDRINRDGALAPSLGFNPSDLDNPEIDIIRLVETEFGTLINGYGAEITKEEFPNIAEIKVKVVKIWRELVITSAPLPSASEEMHSVKPPIIDLGELSLENYS